MSLRDRIVEEIRQRGPMPFSRYMELCLYEPELGYYSRRKEQFGKAGDFYTSSDVHAVFGRLLARQFDEMWRAMGAPSQIEIVELGPGRGLFAQDVLDWSNKKFWDFRDALTYRLVESSPVLRSKLEDRFAERIANNKLSVHESFDELPASPDNAIVFGNEFFDALPVEVICDRGELRIDVDRKQRFVETWAPASSAELSYIERYAAHTEEGERIEVRLADEAYIKRIAGRGDRAFVALIDYGYTQEELLAGRTKSTLRAFRQHGMSATPYEAPGEQDITAHVNFTALRQFGLAAGLEHLGLVTQAQFLMGIGEPNQFADAFEDVVVPQEHAKTALQLKHLITPAGMGEVFQVLLMRRGIEKEKAARLSGLKFMRQL
jgi:SAM-dependent MidA family methyltransferase